MKYPHRTRRLRRNQLLRQLSSEIHINPKQLIQPYFIVAGENVEKPISSMPGIFQQSCDKFLIQVEKDVERGMQSVLLFGSPEEKDAHASQACQEDGVIPQTIKKLKDRFGEHCLVISDVCLCPYTDHGHCGVIHNQEVANDRSVSLLAKQALIHAHAGADIVAPSDMMDGRVAAIRSLLDDHDQENTSILSYSAKYASNYYGPFRDAAECAPQFGDRKSYQMDYHRKAEASQVVERDIQEGADMVMVKPALAYLDIIQQVKSEYDVPMAAYNVSGEYSMVKLMAEKGYADEQSLVLENLTAIKRAGADIIVSYHTRDIFKHRWLD